MLRKTPVIILGGQGLAELSPFWRETNAIKLAWTSDSNAESDSDDSGLKSDSGDSSLSRLSECYDDIHANTELGRFQVIQRQIPKEDLDWLKKQKLPPRILRELSESINHFNTLKNQKLPLWIFEIRGSGKPELPNQLNEESGLTEPTVVELKIGPFEARPPYVTVDGYCFGLRAQFTRWIDTGQLLPLLIRSPRNNPRIHFEVTIIMPNDIIIEMYRFGPALRHDIDEIFSDIFLRPVNRIEIEVTALNFLDSEPMEDGFFNLDSESVEDGFLDSEPMEFFPV